MRLFLWKVWLNNDRSVIIEKNKKYLKISYLLDFRRKVLEIKKNEQLSYEESGRRFGIGKQTVYRWSKRLEPKLVRYKPARKIDMERLEHDIKMYPNAYQRERAERFGVSAVGILKALRCLGVSYKKNLKSSKGGSRKKICIVPNA